MDQPSVAVLILNYNGRERLEKYLPSILDLDYENYRVTVVDNASTDDSVTFVRDRFPEIEVVENEGNLGISRGLNRGVAAAPDVDYLWLLNNDVRVTPSSLDELVKHMEANPDVGVTCPRVNFMDSERIQFLGVHYDVFSYTPPRDRGRMRPTELAPQEVPIAMGAALLIDRAVFDEIGGYDDENFIYGDDTWLSLQAWLRGYRVTVVPESVVYHEPGDHIVATVTDAFHTTRSDTRLHLKSLQTRSLVIGFPGFLARVFVRSVHDAVVRRSPRLGAYRLAGVVDALTDLPEILRDRRRIQRERKYPDDRYLSPLFGKDCT